MHNKREIEIIAYEIYQRNGCIPGRELDHWLEAEIIFNSRQTVPAAVRPASSKQAVAAPKDKKKIASKESKATVERKVTKKISAKAKPRKSGSQKEASL